MSSESASVRAGRTSGSSRKSAGKAQKAKFSERAREFLEKVGKYGFGARAAVYILLGVVSIQIALGVPGTEGSDNGALQVVVGHTGGLVILTIIFFGMIAYALWLLGQAFFGAVGEGDSVWPRVVKGFGGLLYISLASGCAQIILGRGKSQSAQSEGYTAWAMKSLAGRVAVAIVGVVIVIAGLDMLREGVTRGFEKFFRMSEIPQRLRSVVVGLGVFGTVIRGVVFGLVGVFLVLAAIHNDPRKGRGLDYALRSLARTSLGPSLLIFVAVGLIIFGLFGFTEAVWRRTKPPAESPVDK